MATVIQGARGAVGQAVRETSGISTFESYIAPGRNTPMPMPYHGAHVISGRINEDSLVPLPSVDPEEDSMAIISPVLTDTSPVGDGTPAKLRQLQLDDSDIKFVLEAKESDTRPADDIVKAKSTEVRKLLQIWDQLVVSNCVLKHRFEDEGKLEVCQWVVPKDAEERDFAPPA